MTTLGLSIEHLREFLSDGASVMVGKRGSVAVRFRKVPECETVLNVYCICYRLTRACCYTADIFHLIK